MSTRKEESYEEIENCGTEKQFNKDQSVSIGGLPDDSNSNIINKSVQMKSKAKSHAVKSLLNTKSFKRINNKPSLNDDKISKVPVPLGKKLLSDFSFIPRK